MRRTMMFKTSDILNRELFILDQELSRPLLAIRGVTFNISRMDMVRMKTQVPRSMKQFVEEQERQRELLDKEIERVENQIKDKLVESCDKSMKTFKEENRISLNENQEPAAGDSNDEAEPFLVGDETHKQMPYTQEATTRTHYKRLTKYIRLIDYMLMDSKLSLISNSIGNVLAIVSEPMANKKVQSSPLFEIEVNFHNRELYFAPSRFELREAIKRAITEGIQIVCNNEQFLTCSEFELYTSTQETDDKLMDEQNDLMAMAIGSDSLVKETEKIYTEVDKAFAGVQEFAKRY